MWWEDWFGHVFDCLTQSEARRLSNTTDADTIEIELLLKRSRKDQPWDQPWDQAWFD